MDDVEEMEVHQRIFLRDYEVVASIGIHEFERKNPQRIIVDVSLEISGDAQKCDR